MPVLPAALWPKYRTALLLSGFIVLGWLWDFALGGGLAHSLAWALALVLVGGISALAAHGADPPAGQLTDPARAGSAAGPAPVSNTAIRPATPADFTQLIEVEQAADKLFEVAGYGATPGPATPAELAAAALLLVAGDPPIGYARVEIVDGQAHLAGLSVRPRSMRRGVGTALVQASCDWAADAGYAELTLCTFAEVPWNAPFYFGLGFVERTELTDGLRALRADEQRTGLDAMGRRIVLVRSLAPDAG